MTKADRSDGTADQLSEKEAAEIRSLLASRTGVVLGADRDYLVQARTGILAGSLGIRARRDLYCMAMLDQEPQIRELLVDALLTKETSFFRDRHPFSILEHTFLPALQARRTRRPIRIWSAGCATGQEAYSIAMLLEESGPHNGPRPVEIVGTDISPSAVEKALSGRYSQVEVGRGLPAPLLLRYFEQSGHDWVVRQKIRDRVVFRCADLLGDPDPNSRFDLILCRNVAIYFDNPNRRRLLDRLAAALVPDGILIMGGSESATRYSDRFRAVRADEITYYPRKEAG